MEYRTCLGSGLTGPARAGGRDADLTTVCATDEAGLAQRCDRTPVRLTFHRALARARA